MTSARTRGSRCLKVVSELLGDDYARPSERFRCCRQAPSNHWSRARILNLRRPRRSRPSTFGRGLHVQVDNALMENLWFTLKIDSLPHELRSRDEAESAIFEYIVTWSGYAGDLG